MLTQILLGSDIDTMTDQELAQAVETSQRSLPNSPGSKSTNHPLPQIEMDIGSAIWEMGSTMPIL